MRYVPSLYTAARTVVGLSVGTIFTAGLLLYRYQRSLVYPSNFPSGSRTDVPSPDQYGIEYEEIMLETPDGEKLHAYLMPQLKISEKEKSRGEEQGSEETMKRRPTVIVFHANAGNMGHRIPLAAVFYKRFGCNVLMLSYRGYGRSTGQASEVGIRIDAQTALDYIKTHSILKDTIIIVYGQSLGGAVAIDVASRNSKSIKGLILENTFQSIPTLIPHVLPLIRPFSFLCREYWPSEESIKKIPPQTPVLFLTGRQDELVPPSHMDTLIKNCSSRVKVRMTLHQGNHNDTCIQPGYFEAVGLYIARYIVPLTSGGEEAALAAQETASKKYKFLDNSAEDVIDIVVNKVDADTNTQVTSTTRQRQPYTSTADSDSDDWVEMSGSVAPQDTIKQKL